MSYNNSSYNQNYYLLNKETYNIQGKEWYKNNKQKHHDLVKRNRLKKKQDIINHYGGKCICCGESRLIFLAINHALKNGAKHRKEIGNKGGSEFYRWLVKNNYPEDFNVMCHNCNFSSFLDICPHKITNNWWESEL